MKKGKRQAGETATQVQGENPKKAVAAKATEDRITEKKELKYKYPADCEEGGTKAQLLIKRKKFRHEVRKNLRNYEKKAAALMEKAEAGDAAAQKELRGIERADRVYRREVLMNPKASVTAEGDQD